MKKNIRSWSSLLWALSLLFPLAACAPPAKEAKRYFWPIGFERPRIEYLEFFQTAEDLRRDEDHWLYEAIFGKEIPRNIFLRPADVAADGNRRVFVSDIGSNRVLVLDRQNKAVRFLQEKEGQDCYFRHPAGMAVDAVGGIYVADSIDHAIVHFDARERKLASFGQNDLTRPAGLAFDAARQRLYVVDTGTHQVAVFDLEGELLRKIGQRGTAPGEFNFPLDLDVDADGNLFVLDTLNARVQVFDPEGKFLRSFGERGTALGSFQLPKGIAVSPSGHVYVTDSQAHRFVIFDREGNYLLTVGGRAPIEEGKISPGGFYLPHGIDVGSDEAIWVVDTLNRIIHRFQYLNESYLAAHPILPGETYLPPDLLRESRPSAAGNIEAVD